MNDIEDSGIGQLERRVEQVIGRVRQLVRERDDALAREREVQERLAQLEARLEEKVAQLQTMQEESIARAEFEARKRELEQRVEGLLARFGEIDEALGD